MAKNNAINSTYVQTSIDFGALPTFEATFTIIDAAIQPTDLIICEIAYVAPPGKDLDELEFDELDLKAVADSGQFTLYARAMENAYVADQFTINYYAG